MSASAGSVKTRPHGKSQDHNSDDDDEITLPDDTLAILQQFLKEKADRERLEEEAAATTTDDECQPKPTFKAFEENWQLSQFWYNERTKAVLAAASVRCTANNRNATIRIGLLSCPSLYESIKAAHPNATVRLFEFDERFAAYGTDFVHYDYNRAIDDESLLQFNDYFDLLIADPPFLAEECIQKMASIVQRLLNRNGYGRVILCSGQVVGDWAQQHMGLHRCRFQPEHERNLGNAFASYANFDLDEFIETVTVYE